MVAVREEDITKLYSSVSDIANILRTSSDEILSWVKAGDILFSVGKNKDNKILVYKLYLIEFLREKGLLIEKPIHKNVLDSKEVPIIKKGKTNEKDINASLTSCHSPTLFGMRT